MNSVTILNTLRQFVLLLTILSVGTVHTGCTVAGRYVGEFHDAVQIRRHEWRELSRIREDTREELAKQREEARRVAAERDIQEALVAARRQQLEAELCQARQEALERHVTGQFQESLESKVAFNVVHGLEVGELEVDMEELKRLIEEREQQPPEALEKPPEPLKKKPCECCDRPCGCKVGLVRRLCPHCRLKPCEAHQPCNVTREEDCGGPEALTRAEQEPLRRPLRPTEIPLKLPVRLSFGMEQPYMEAARIRREIPEALRKPPEYEPCDNGAPCDEKGCPVHSPHAGGPQRPAVPPEMKDPPVPVADPIDSVQSLPPTSIDGTRVGFVPFSAGEFFSQRPRPDEPSETFMPARWLSP